MLVTSKAALDRLATCAPRAWCKRMLNWEVFWGSLNLYARDGSVRLRWPAYEILRESGWISAPHDELTQEQLTKINALERDEDVEALVRAVASPRLDQVDWDCAHWGIADGPLPIGVIVAQTRLDWEAGDLIAEITSGLLANEWFASAEEVFAPFAI